MPKKTFFNLPDDKRALICNVAIEEFAAHPFEQVSINRIVAKTNIAKGSFYQYFENKKDLFFYLMQLAGEAKLSYLTPALQNPAQHNFFTLLRELYRSGIQFAIAYPKLAEIGKKLMMSKDTPILADLIESSMPAAQEFFEPLLQNAINRGEIRADIDVKLFAYLIASMHTQVVEYYINQVAQEYDETMMSTLDQFIEFLKQGIGKNEIQDKEHAEVAQSISG
ncbi:MAG: TetR/AcrR family transcriptional regulator [Anaerolineae bacterium]